MRQTQTRGQPASTNADSNATELATATAFWSCAICGLRFPRSEIKSHAEGCSFVMLGAAEECVARHLNQKFPDLLFFG
jgi:hypothetical protein